MKVFVTGASGQLGHDVMLELKKRQIDALGTDRSGSSADFKTVPLDITDPAAVKQVLTEYHPDAIIHCAAWTNVDAAELPENRKKVQQVNVEGTKNLASAAKDLGAKFVYISTDYVFPGNGDQPWQPDDKNFAPQNFYGETKLQGEKAVENLVQKFFIVRIAWVFGQHGKNFVQTMLNLSENHSALQIVSDQIGTPTYCPDLARLLVDIIETEKYGFYHATNEGGYISWADFATEIFRQANKNTKVIPVTTAEYEKNAGKPTAPRPKNSRLDKSKLVQAGFTPLPTWQDALSRFLAA